LWTINKMTDKTTVDLLKNHFDIALETPDGVKKLRELILSLAMQGKLVPQDPKDQPMAKFRLAMILGGY
jgi:type I restriction enzyme S subunit